MVSLRPAAHSCVYQQEDDKGTTGVFLSKELMRIAGHALKANITNLGPLVLPISEQLLFFANLVARKVLRLKVRRAVCLCGWGGVGEGEWVQRLCRGRAGGPFACVACPLLHPPITSTSHTCAAGARLHP